ncbi:MarR family winged helix-turn-helix transcriptional regulator [Rhodovulum sp. DZ06]|uniref:MarR family winged helix-turn-helix transcriptional regulator n=1 Tax=Rhodovulum sp. DZ06 TaxID=3425126 RepID=UPI003D344527
MSPQPDAAPAAAEPIARGPEDLALARQRLRLWLQMLKAVRYVENDLRERLRANYDMTLPRFDVLAALHAAPEGLKMGDLSQQLMVSNGNVTGIVDRLTREGLAERNPVATDRRAFLIKITPKGAALMDDMAAAHLSWIDGLFENVPEGDVARAISIMLDLRHKAQG